MAYIDVVAVKDIEEDRVRLFSAPPCTGSLHEGTMAKAEGEDEYGKVIAKDFMDEDGEDLRFVARILGEEMPLKRVTSVMEYHEISYDPPTAEGN